MWIFWRSIHERSSLLWLLLLLASDLMLLPMAFYALRGEFSQTLFLFMEMPLLFIALTLSLINAQAYRQVWKANRPALSGLLLAMAILLALMAVGEGLAILIILILPLLIAGLWVTLRRLGSVLAGALSLATLAVLALEAGGALSSRWIGSPNWRGATSLIGVLAIFLAFAFQVLLVQRALNGDRDRSWLARVALLALACLLFLGVGAVEMRHAVLVKATGRAFEDHLPFVTSVLAFVAGAILIATLTGRRRIAAAAYLVLAPCLVLGAYILGWVFNPQAITQARAARIAAALERYHQQTGDYPTALNQLTPRYLPILLGPLTGRDQIWCYQGGTDFYRLGYVWYQRYSEPTFFEPLVEIRIYSSAGQPPPGAWICDQERERFISSLGF